jgi:hypothetical protein
MTETTVPDPAARPDSWAPSDPLATQYRGIFQQMMTARTLRALAALTLTAPKTGKTNPP